MNQHLIILPVIVPMAAGIMALMLHRWRSLQRGMGLLMLTANLLIALWALNTVYLGADLPGGILVSQMGNWPAPFGITIAIDMLSAIMIATAAAVCLAVFVYCIFQLPERFEGGFFHPLFHLLLFGVNWSFVTGDLFNLFVAFEIMLMASYAMFIIGTTRAQMRQAYKYILLNLVGSTMFVTCAGLLYGQLGTLNMADIARISLQGQLPPSSLPVIAMLLLVFGGKTAIFPIWYWLPDTYHTMPAPIGGLFAGLLTKVGAYVMIRVFVMMFGSAGEVTEMLTPLLLVSAAVTMFLGVLGAVSMHSVRQILSIHIISQVGYMVLGIGMATELAIAGAIFFIIHNMAVKCSLFLCAGLMDQHAGSDDLDRIGGLLRRSPWLATLFFIAAMSLAGLPPLSGFFGKYVLVREAVTQQHYVLAAFAMLTSVLTLLSMLKIWGYGFWSPSRGQHEREPDFRPATHGGLVGIAMLVALALAMGLGAQRFVEAARVAARGVTDPRHYIVAVLGPAALGMPAADEHAGAPTDQPLARAAEDQP
jgi:multicomponent Na+:H+ antiporter subunit D